jgi:hypothetical protein
MLFYLLAIISSKFVTNLDLLHMFLLSQVFPSVIVTLRLHVELVITVYTYAMSI